MEDKYQQFYRYYKDIKAYSRNCYRTIGCSHKYFITIKMDALKMNDQNFLLTYQAEQNFCLSSDKQFYILGRFVGEAYWRLFVCSTPLQYVEIL